MWISRDTHKFTLFQIVLQLSLLFNLLHLLYLVLTSTQLWWKWATPKLINNGMKSILKVGTVLLFHLLQCSTLNMCRSRCRCILSKTSGKGRSSERLKSDMQCSIYHLCHDVCHQQFYIFTTRKSQCRSWYVISIDKNQKQVETSAKLTEMFSVAMLNNTAIKAAAPPTALVNVSRCVDKDNTTVSVY